jgi:hypothetical protein
MTTFLSSARLQEGGFVLVDPIIAAIFGGSVPVQPRDGHWRTAMPRADASRKRCAIYTRKSSEEGLD